MTGIMQVGIVMSNFNYGCYISEAVESVLKSREEAVSSLGPVALRFFIGDDCSTDGSQDEIVKLEAKYSSNTDRFEHYFFNPKSGLNFIFNRLFARVGDIRCRYTLVLDADDRLVPSFFRRTIKTLEVCNIRNSNVGYVYMNAQYMDKDGNAMPVFDEQGSFLGNKTMPYQPFDLASTDGYRIPTPAMAFTRCLTSALPLDENLPKNVNQYRYRKLHLDGGWIGAHLPDIGFEYRMHGHNTCGAGQAIARLDPNLVEVPPARIWDAAPHP